MKVGIMQPYFLPYIGYWQLLNAVDKYVIYDDVNYIKRGWINRNRILVGKEAKFITIKVKAASQNKLINELDIALEAKDRMILLRTIEENYKKAPFFKEVFLVIEEIINYQEDNLAKFIEFSLRKICGYLNITTELILSSELKKDTSLRAEDKILEICKELNATEYYNAIGGQELYSVENFKKEGIELKFLETEKIEYEQFDNEFIPYLSILDLMMFNSVEKIKEDLEKYKLV